MSSTLEHDPRVVAERRGIAGFFADYRQRLRQGDIGQLPVIVGLIAIWSIFYVASNGVFLSPFNLVNLTLQMAAVGSISVGIVLILLLGDIDLSAGVVSGMCAAVMAVLSVQHDVSPQLAVGIALLVGAAVGTLHGVWITRFGIPAFVVTLAGLIAWQGLLLRVLGRTGTINLKDPFITGLAGTFYTGPTAYLLGAAFLAYVAVRPILENRRRRAAGLSVPPATVVWVRAVGFTALVLLAVWYLCQDRGISSGLFYLCLLYTSPSPRDGLLSRMPSSA